MEVRQYLLTPYFERMSKPFGRNYASLVVRFRWFKSADESTIGRGMELEVGAQIKKYRSNMKISQEELAEKVYVSRQTVSNWETGVSHS